jgi:hypothetical protein
MSADPGRPLAAGAGSVPMPAGVSLDGLDMLFTAAEVAEYLKLDISTTRRLFVDSPGVVRIGKTSARAGKRSYCTLRIPLSALRKFLEEHKR